MTPLENLAFKTGICEILTGNEAKGSDDHASDGDVEELLPGRASLASEANLLEDYVLVQVDAVETEDESKTAWFKEMKRMTYAISRRNQQAQVAKRILKCSHSEKYCKNSAKTQ